MKDRIDLLLRIVAFGLISVAILVLLLNWIGIIHFPNFEDVIIAWISGLTAQMFSVERRLSKLVERNEIIWSDFKKRKKLF
jgi:hypothetical protein